MIASIERKRLQISRQTEAAKKSKLGQFFTPQPIAEFMADLFPPASGPCRLLDAGAGIGSLSSAFLNRWMTGSGFDFSEVSLDVYEIDRSLGLTLNESIKAFSHDPRFSFTVHHEDFVIETVERLTNGLFSMPPPVYTHVILNPPYKKIQSSSLHRKHLERVGLQTVNLYSAFVALGLALCGKGGQVVAIIPRSFCNGPYYRPFREFLLQHSAIRNLHLFESRTSAFKDDGVLQENIILRIEKQGKQTDVDISWSSNDQFSDFSRKIRPFEAIVDPDDPEKFIRIPSGSFETKTPEHTRFHHRLEELGVEVSTGPVVDFRLKNFLSPMPEEGCIPLLYPCHFKREGLTWPLEDSKKPNAIRRASETEKWLFPSGNYCVVRRLSSKEEKRRVVAGFVGGDDFPGMEKIAFENHLNVFHFKKKGLPPALAKGLSAFLSASCVDETFRSFNGHTQVNATDLRQLKYPDRDKLTQLGAWAMSHPGYTQEELDEIVGGL